jgi:Rrf2 family protein
MLRISKKADYAVFLLGSIARQGAYPGGRAATSVVSAHEVARQAGLNKSVVANLLKEFAKNSLLESVRGLRGGYRLLRAPQAISLAEILTVVEGPFSLVDCLRHHDAGSGLSRSGLPGSGLPGSGLVDEHHLCALIGFCPTRSPLRILHQRIADMFRAITLAELAGLEAGQRPVDAALVNAGVGQRTTADSGDAPSGAAARTSNRIGVAK